MKKSLSNTAAEINKLHGDFCKGLITTLQTAVKIGELLSAEKAKHEHGEWQTWMLSNLTFSDRTARDYMRVFANKDKIADIAKMGTVKIDSIKDAIRLITAPTEEEIEAARARMALSEEKVKQFAQARIAAEQAEREHQQQQSEDEETIEEMDDDAISLELLEEEEVKESDEEFTQRVQEMVESMRKNMEAERSGKNSSDRAKRQWKMLSGHLSSKEQRKREAKLMVAFLMKKYPQLMDEGDV